MVRTQVLKHLPKEGREEGAREMSGEERLPKERCRRVGVSGSLRGRRSEEMTQLNTAYTLEESKEGVTVLRVEMHQGSSKSESCQEL